MRLTDIKSGQTVFIDANIFIYHFGGVSPECKEFLKRCAQKDLIAFSSYAILAEVCHRLMAMEAAALKLTKSLQPSAYLQKHPQIVKKLSQYYAQMTNIFSWNIEIIPPPQDLIIKSQLYRQRFGLLTNDSFIPVYMEAGDTASLATSDQVFHSITSLHLYAPSDIHL